ncbi:MAG: OmpA family protein [Candidatus Zixiibacteriota bacterium]
MWHRRIMRVAGAILGVLIIATPAAAEDYRYALGGGAGLVSMSGGKFFSFPGKAAFEAALAHRLSSRWQLVLDYSVYTLANDENKLSVDTSGSFQNNSPLDFAATRLGIRLDRKLSEPDRLFNLTAGLGGGLLIWKGIDPDSNTTYVVRGDQDQPTDFSATELFLGGSLGILVRPSPRVSLHFVGQADRLTGAGAEFEPEISDIRDKLLLTASARVYFHFGQADRTEWASDKAWSTASERPELPRQARRDSDGDGIDDTLDSCLSTPRGADVDASGCPVDSDRDGVQDGLDDCPSTPTPARNRVDIHGCPVDSDYDGLPDYADSCAFGLVGAQVDERGCPIDSDNDGVPEGLDDCPYTLPGVEVDKHGCIDLTMLSKPMVLNIDYAPGSFEVDPHNRKRIERLGGLLNFVPDIKIDINGYTDDIGTDAANRALSEKRANRVKGILQSLGIDADRMKAYGRGETNFVASNQTAEGRARNRRIEIVFYK